MQPSYIGIVRVRLVYHDHEFDRLRCTYNRGHSRCMLWAQRDQQLTAEAGSGKLTGKLRLGFVGLHQRRVGRAGKLGLEAGQCPVFGSVRRPACEQLLQNLVCDRRKTWLSPTFRRCKCVSYPGSPWRGGLEMCCSDKEKSVTSVKTTSTATRTGQLTHSKADLYNLRCTSNIV